MFSRIMLVLLVCLGSSLVSVAAFADGNTKALQPVRLSESYKDGKRLETLPPWPKSMIIRPLTSHGYVDWYVGSDLTCMIYQASDGVLRLTNTTYDERSRVLHGTAILTSVDGQVHVFHVGDTFVVPKGWSGTWEFKGGYREELAFYTKTLNGAMKSLFNK